jgi:hypothetical protein
MIDASYRDSPLSSFRKGFLITPHDTNPLAQTPYKGVWVGATGGNIVCSLIDDPATFLTFPVAANSLFPGVPYIVKSTGTTATTLHGVL